MPKQSTQVLERAKRGAEVQLRELLHEARLLIELFPHLRDAFDKDELPLKFIMAEGSGAATKTGARRMSAAARKDINDPAKKSWTRRRKVVTKA